MKISTTPLSPEFISKTTRV